ncbi:MAG TPA: hypothetical protein VGI81_27925 [Tepidisphaeraceae bacterium]
MIRRRVIVASVVLLVLGVASACAWYATARFTFEDPAMPIATVVSFAAAVPLLLVRPLFPALRAERRRRGCCLHCGYDLQASKDRCPECGTPTTSNAGTPA